MFITAAFGVVIEAKAVTILVEKEGCTVYGVQVVVVAITVLIVELRIADLFGWENRLQALVLGGGLVGYRVDYAMGTYRDTGGTGACRGHGFTVRMTGDIRRIIHE